MYKKLIFLLLVLSIFVAELKAATFFPESDSIIISYTAKEIVIQSFKQNNDLSLQPISATVLSDQVIRDRNITNMKNLSAFVPNLFLPDYGSKMTSPVYIRGIGSRTNTPSVGLYVDGIPYFDRSTFDFDINDVDRIEVLRGPQGTIYGRNTMGGIINVYTKSPFKYKETNLTLSAGNYDNYRISASRYGQLSKKLGYAVSGNYHTSGGYFRNVTTGKKADPVDEVSTRIRLNWLVSPDFRLNLISAYEYSDQDGYPYALYNDTTNTVDNIDYNAHSFYRRNMSSTGLHAEYQTDLFKLSSQSSFQYFDGVQGLDQDFSPQDTYYVNYLERQQMYSQEFNMKSVNNSLYQWQFGLFGFHQNYYYNSNVDTRNPAIAAGTYKNKIQDVKNPTMGVAVYHQSTLNNLLTRGLSLSMGIRYDWEKTKAKTGIREIDVNGGLKEENPRGKDYFTQFTPKVSLQYTFMSEDVVYFSASKGYKAGGFNPTAQLKDDYSYDPERSWSYEVGAKTSCFDKLISTDVSLFYIRWTNQQISQTQPDGKGYILRNAGRSASKGAEIAMHINPLASLSFHLTYGYTQAKFRRYEDSQKGINYNDNSLPMVPKHTFSLSADYVIKLKDFWVDRILLNAQYTGLGKLYWKEDNVAYQKFYGVIDGKISLEKKNTSIDFWMKNIGNKDYISYYFFTSKAYAQKGKPFTCGVNLNLKF